MSWYFPNISQYLLVVNALLIDIDKKSPISALFLVRSVPQVNRKASAFSPEWSWPIISRPVNKKQFYHRSWSLESVDKGMVCTSRGNWLYANAFIWFPFSPIYHVNQDITLISWRETPEKTKTKILFFREFIEFKTRDFHTFIVLLNLSIFRYAYIYF